MRKIRNPVASLALGYFLLSPILVINCTLALVLLQMTPLMFGHFDNDGLSCFWGTWRLCLSISSQLKPQTFHLGLQRLSDRWSFDVRGLKSLPSFHTNNAIFWTYILWKVMKFYYKVLTINLVLFSLPPVTLTHTWDHCVVCPSEGGFEI
jgi:hypothetical protein